MASRGAAAAGGCVAQLHEGDHLRAARAAARGIAPQSPSNTARAAATRSQRLCRCHRWCCCRCRCRCGWRCRWRGRRQGWRCWCRTTDTRQGRPEGSGTPPAHQRSQRRRRRWRRRQERGGRCRGGRCRQCGGAKVLCGAAPCDPRRGEGAAHVQFERDQRRAPPHPGHRAVVCVLGRRPHILQPEAGPWPLLGQP